MSGNRVGAIKAKKTNLERYGEDFYSVIGSKGGKAKVTKGFGANRELAVKAGMKGGKASCRKFEFNKHQIKKLKKLRDREKLTWVEIAQEMGFTYNVVRSRYIENVDNYVKWKR